MKKIILLTLSTLLLTNTPQVNNASFDDVNLSNDVTNNLINKLNNSIELNTRINFHYDSYLKDINIVDQFDANNRVNIIRINDYVLQESYIKKGNNGEALESYLSISNTVEERNITKGDENVSFNSMFASPFLLFCKLNNEKINSYFTVKENDSSYELIANSLGYGVFSNQLLNFYYDYDSFVWDESVTRSIKDLKLNIDKQGNPISLSFNKIKKDIFGGIKETYNIDINTLDEIKKLTPEPSKLTPERASIFNSKLNNFQNLLNQGNFTQKITIALEGNSSGYTYSNFYALNNDEEREFPPAMLCNLPLYDASYGETYIGIFETSTGYSTAGISVDKDYSSIISETNSTNINDVIPNVNKISCDYFTYNALKDTYTFDFTNFIYADSYFSGTLLLSLFGIADPATNILGLYINNYSYSFNTLTFKFDINGYLSGTLNYNYNNMVLESKFSFANIGTTNLLNEQSVQKPVSYYLMNGGIDE